jgi:hypothetical protein
MSENSIKLYTTGVVTDIENELLKKYYDAIVAYREFMKIVWTHDENNPDYTWEETHFGDMCLGFMIAKGVDIADAFHITSIMRYNISDFRYDPEVNPKSPLNGK